MSDYDIVTLGEALLRLSPSGYARFQQADHFEAFVGGSELNTAIGLAQLGLRVSWVSRLTDNGLGRLVESTLHRFQVDTSTIVWTQADRLGLYFLEQGRAPRPTTVIYDRANSAAANMHPHELKTEIFHPNGARLFHVTGITLAIGQPMRETARQAVQLAKENGWQVSFDLNYRSKLWGIHEARETCEPFMQQADVVFIPYGDACHVYETQAAPNEVLKVLSAQFPHAVIVMTMGEQGAAAYTPDGHSYHQPTFHAEEVSRIGRGDAFSAGFLYCYLTTHDIPLALKWGAALAALKYSIEGDFPVFSRAEVENMVMDEQSGYFR